MRRPKLFQLYPLLLLILILVLSSCDLGPRGKAQLGQPAPDFILEDLTGQNWRMDDLRGEVVLLYFWATWCPPCRESLPSLESLHREMALAAQPFQLLAVLSNDDPAQASRLIGQLGLTFPILADQDNKVARLYGLTGVPEAWIIDSNGILRERFIGSRPWDSPEARKILKEYM
jgi:cytochrome c biogenesis protein CcmG, thiol:disulfide interchange protein DsbE